MFVYSTTKRRFLRGLAITLSVCAAVGIALFVIFSSISSSAAGKKIPIYCVDRGDNKIALTFDCAWGNSNTDELLDILDSEDIKATFFVTGEFCEKYPEDILRLFKAGHEIENHSDRHPHLNGININDLIADTRACENKIEAITGVPPTLYRAPYGEYDDNAMQTLEGMGYRVIQWSVDSVDWKEPSAAEIVSKVCKNTVSGSILLFHNDLSNTAEALPEILSTLKKNGYDFVKTSELIYADNYHIDNAGKQIFDVNVSETAFSAYSANAALSEVLYSLRQSMTEEQLSALLTADRMTILAMVTPYLGSEQISELSMMSDEEIRETLRELLFSVGEDIDGDGMIEEMLPEAYYIDDCDEKEKDSANASARMLTPDEEINSPSTEGDNDPDNELEIEEEGEIPDDFTDTEDDDEDDLAADTDSETELKPEK